MILSVANIASIKSYAAEERKIILRAVVDEKGQAVSKKYEVMVGENPTYGDVVKAAKAQGLNTEGITGWRWNPWKEIDCSNDKLDPQAKACVISAMYEDRIIISAVLSYASDVGGEKGASEIRDVLAYRTETCEDLIKKLNIPTSVDDITLNEWDISGNGGKTFAKTDKVEPFMQLRAKYSKTPLWIEIPEYGENKETTTKLVFVEPGTKVSELLNVIPKSISSSIDGFKAWKFSDYFSENKELLDKAIKDYDYYNVYPVISKDDDTNSPNVINEVEDAIKAVENAKNEGKDIETPKVVVSMKNDDGSVSTKAPVEVLEKIKGKDIDVVLDMGTYSWTINGGDISAESISDINLEVKVVENVVPVDVVKSLAGDNPTKQISLTHNGEFGFKAVLNLEVGSEYKGKYGNLFWYDNDGKINYIDSGYIDENGKVNLAFSHASDYVIVIGEKHVENTTKSPKTGDDTNIMMYLTLLILGGAAIAGTIVYRRKVQR